MLVRDVLAKKGRNVVTVDPDFSVLDAVRVLVEYNIGAVLVTDRGTLVGILSERDVLRLTAKGPEMVAGTSVGDAMTTDLVVGLPTDDVSYAMAVMTNNRVRHLPILDDDLVGIVSIGDLVNATLTSLEAENRWLRDYVQGGG